MLQAAGDYLLPFGFVLQYPKGSGKVFAGTRQQEDQIGNLASFEQVFCPLFLYRPGDRQIQALDEFLRQVLTRSDDQVEVFGWD